jgi:glutaredoxin 3
MATKRKVEVFSAGCATCNEAIDVVKRAACGRAMLSCSNMHDREVAKRAKALGVRSIPAVVIDGKLAACCTDRGINEEILRAAGLGTPL